MIKKILGLTMVASCLALALPAFAATSPSTKPSAAQVACVSNAVNAREQALDSGISTYTQAVSAAYMARASALRAAYSQTPGNSVIVKAVKAAWSAFNTAMKSARGAWQSIRASAWSAFRTSVNACKAPAVATDSANASSEASGQ